MVMNLKGDFSSDRYGLASNTRTQSNHLLRMTLAGCEADYPCSPNWQEFSKSPMSLMAENPPSHLVGLGR